MIKGLVSLDIDGTLTDKTHHIPKEVTQYLKNLVKKGFVLVLNTGRAFAHCRNLLKDFDFPYFLTLQNGADILKVPEMQRISHQYFEKSTVLKMEEIYQHYQEDFLLYAGYDNGDFCYYRHARFSPKMHDYLDALKKLSEQPWQSVTSFSEIAQMTFPMIKCFGERDMLEKLEKALKKDSLHTTIIKDPMSAYFLFLITAQHATKGQALKTIKHILQYDGGVIAAGDDQNDLSMLKLADIKIVMQSAPLYMHNLADIIAFPSVQQGIIQALEQALKKWTI